MDIQHLFQERLPHRPHCTDDFKYGLTVRSKADALRFRHIQPNPPLAVAWLIFDLDYAAAAIGWETANLPEPTIIAVNPENAHAHVFYGLQTPVSTSVNARDKPKRYAEAVARAMRIKLNADPGYTSYMAKNPCHPAWRTLWSNNLYDLDYLAEWVSLPDHPLDYAQPLPLGLKRNSALFERLRRWAYRQVLAFKRAGRSFDQWQAYVLGQAEEISQAMITNQEFRIALPFNEVKTTAKSAAKWTWNNFTEATFSAIQAARGRKGGRPKSTTEKPWVALGISKSTYYRRKQKGQLGTAG